MPILFYPYKNSTTVEKFTAEDSLLLEEWDELIEGFETAVSSSSQPQSEADRFMKAKAEVAKTKNELAEAHRATLAQQQTYTQARKEAMSARAKFNRKYQQDTEIIRKLQKSIKEENNDVVKAEQEVRSFRNKYNELAKYEANLAKTLKQQVAKYKTYLAAQL
jgi:hypothetical protein